MDPVKIPKMSKTEYDALVHRQYIARIGFGACGGAYVAPFVYVFDGKFLYFLSSRYGRKVLYFKNNPHVSVEIEEYSPDLSEFRFISLQGRLEELQDPGDTRRIREMFIGLIRKRGLSPGVIRAFGHSPEDPVEAIARGERSMVWKLAGVQDIVALKNA